jgi:hypothetical protein
VQSVTWTRAASRLSLALWEDHEGHRVSIMNPLAQVQLRKQVGVRCGSLLDLALQRPFEMNNAINNVMIPSRFLNP